MKKNGMPGWVAITVPMLMAVVLLSSCQIPGRVVSVEQSKVCPMCQTELRTAPIKGLTYTTHICPMCKKVSTIDPNAPMSMQDYVDDDASTVQVCDNCGAVVCNCPACKGK